MGPGPHITTWLDTGRTGLLQPFPLVSDLCNVRMYFSLTFCDLSNGKQYCTIMNVSPLRPGYHRKDQFNQLNPLRLPSTEKCHVNTISMQFILININVV